MSLLSALRRKHEIVYVSDPLHDEHWEVLVTVRSNQARDIEEPVSVSYYDGNAWTHGKSHPLYLPAGGVDQTWYVFEAEPEIIRVTISDRMHEHDLTDEDRESTER